MVAGAFSLFGITHSPLPGSPILLPNEAMAQAKAQSRDKAIVFQTPYHWAAAYWLAALLIGVVGKTGRAPEPEPDDASLPSETAGT